MTAYLTDADVWICVCYTRLSARAADHQLDLDPGGCDALAKQLKRDATYGQRDPVAAADAYLQAMSLAAA